IGMARRSIAAALGSARALYAESAACGGSGRRLHELPAREMAALYFLLRHCCPPYRDWCTTRPACSVNSERRRFNLSLETLSGLRRCTLASRNVGIRVARRRIG